MEKLFLIVALLLPVGVMDATEYDYLAIRQLNGTESLVKSAGLRINISDGKFIVSHADGTGEFPLSDLASISFRADSERPSGIEDLFCSEDSFVDVYDESGKYVGRFVSKETAVETLSPGTVYVIRNEKGTIKKLIIK